MSPRLSLAQLNIEHEKHIEPVSQFLAQQKPDVACLQEVFQSDIPHFEKILGATCFFAPMSRRMVRDAHDIEGVAIFSRLPVKQSGVEYYVGSGLPDAYFDARTAEAKRGTQGYALPWCDVEKEGVTFRIATTHFTWSAHGLPNDHQRTDLKTLLQRLETLGELVVCGDFNAPRGGEIFSILAQRFTDNVPAAYTTSIDGTFHRAGHLELMVDGIFTTPSYRASDVQRVGGVSDHYAFTASVEKVDPY